ncbi:NAD(P)H-hydrate epimerase [Stieleria sp. TO1_6]|uniref:NAD(P)H-hydrate epimerase n=1 Tax=Stieleria tagensis TaxID=2956795 RepID=UPI00209B8332|nr:NAD(P)H-hydrate epimerase [Stieleria tagensis]MCO8123630.1 NAD(P)H-hydrate epimerase [Stieleria tagensis]
MKRDQVRQIDQIAIDEFGLSGLVLMENAGRGAADRIVTHYPAEKSVGILCGTGNNGGDGYVIARHLQCCGMDVRIISLVPLEKLTGDARSNAEIAQRAQLPIAIASGAGDLRSWIPANRLVVDCMLGTGASGAPRGLYADAVRIANGSDVKRIAIDLPTGLDCDTGQAYEPTFQAELTVTFVAEKAGFANAAARSVLGRVETVGIGVPQILLDRFGVKPA